jgi:hypothetical protein
VAGRAPAAVTQRIRQVIGRTPGDLIVALPAPDNVETMLGTIQSASIIGSKPLLLDGVFSTT